MQMQDLKPGANTKTATLAWLVEALEHARSRGQTKVIGYLEEVADDVVFEVEMRARRASLVRQRLLVLDYCEHLAPRGPDYPQSELR